MTFGEGFRDISAYALARIEEYIGEKCGAAADARYNAAYKARKDEADILGLRIVRLLEPEWPENVIVCGGTSCEKERDGEFLARWR
jgi:hypothetical protein